MFRKQGEAAERLEGKREEKLRSLVSSTRREMQPWLSDEPGVGFIQQETSVLDNQ